MKIKVDREAFLREQKRMTRAKARPNEASRVKMVFSARDFRQVIRLAAKKHRQCRITYVKTTTNETKTYRICPYSYRYRMSRNGMRKFLYAWDDVDGRIKGYVLRNVRKAEMTDFPFQPKWRIEIS